MTQNMHATTAITAAVQVVTPQIAQEWLARNTGNRPFRNDKIASYTRDMQAGNWQVTGEAIKFDRTGRLLDGQNRLAAVIRAGVPVAFMVIEGLEPSTQEVMDSGTPRSNADAITLRRTSAVDGLRGKELAPVATVYKAWKSGGFAHAASQRVPTYTHSEVLEILDHHPGLEDATRLALPARRIVRLPIGALGACAYRFTEIDPDFCMDFFDRIVTLRTAGRGDPVATLMRRVHDMRENRTHLRAATAIYFLTRTWNALRTGEQIVKFQLGSAERGWAPIPEPK